MQNSQINNILTDLVNRYPLLNSCKTEIEQAFDILHKCYEDKHKLLVCGNGGSAADSEHIVGELMKSFSHIRILPQSIANNLKAISADKGPYLASKLQPALPAISLTGHVSLNTAFSNDVDPRLIFAQQIIGYGTQGDVLLAISTSGMAENVIYAAIAGRATGLKTVGLTGGSGGELQEYCDVIIRVAGDSTSQIQELHLPVYHALCAMLEAQFFWPEN